MKPIVVSDVMAVGEVPTPEQMEILAKAGFKSIVNNQPDGEVGRLPSSAKFSEIARKHGLGYAYAPLASRTPDTAELQVYGDALKTLPGPIFGFCYSGARSAAGCALLLTETMEADAIVAQFAAADFDIAFLKPWLDDERKRRAVPALKVNGSGATAQAGTVAPPNGSAKPTAKDAKALEPAAVPLAVSAAAVAAAPKAVEGIVVHARVMGNGGFAM